MDSVEFGPSVKSLAELSLIASRVGRHLIDEAHEPAPAVLRGFWQNLRTLQRNWMEKLDNWSAEHDPQLDAIGQMGLQLFTVEMLSRVWSTVLSEIDRRLNRDDLTRIARNAVGGLLMTRHGIMMRLVQQSSARVLRVAEIDRLRKRCDRWTDLLIGNVAGSGCSFEFAFDPDRARDFATESAEYDPATGPHPVDHLVAAGLRLAFLGQLPATRMTDPAFKGLVDAILGSLPVRAFQPDGSLRSTLELRAQSNPAEHLDPDMTLKSLEPLRQVYFPNSGSPL